LPPLLTGDDSIAVLPKIDCVLLVIADGMSSKAEIEESLRQLPGGTNLVGTVFNKAPMDAVYPVYPYLDIGLPSLIEGYKSTEPTTLAVKSGVENEDSL
jgi:hypothetical protein